MNEDSESNPTDVPPAAEPAATPLVSAAQQSLSKPPCISVDASRYDALELWSDCVADASNGSSADHLQGKLGEDCVARYLGIENRLDTEIYADGGDGGVDLLYRRASIDVKTVGQHRQKSALTVDAYEPLTADYYVLASRVGPTDCRLVGYAPRQFVANAPKRWHEGEPYHFVGQEYLFPFPRL